MLAILIEACSSLNPYAATAAKLSESGYEWRPLGKDLFYGMSQEEAARSRSDLEVCIGQFTKSLVPAGPVPIREVRAFLLLDCMEARGWHLVDNGVVVTS